MISKEILLKLNRVTTRLLSLLLISSLFFTSTVIAATDPERTAIFRDSVFYDETDSGCSLSDIPSTSTTYNKGSKIYIIGDSLTVGMRDSGDIKQKLESNGWAITNTPQINAVVGKSLSWGIEELAKSSERALIQGSDTVLVGLGTNDWGDYPSNTTQFETKMTEIATTIRELNQNASIFWTNLYGTGKYKTAFLGEDGKSGLNASIDKVAQQNNIRVIKWSDVAGTYITTDNEVHPNGKYGAMADYVLTNLNTGASTMSAATSLAGCSCSAGLVTGNYTADERYAYTWGFFVTTKKLSPNAAAGIMGNLEAESGINPQNMQNSAPLPDGPEFPTVTDSTGKIVPDPQIAGKFGYGIAQWTSAGRQQNLIDFAKSSGKSTGDLSLQLDFIWKEFSESYAGVLAKLQEPNVTIAAASEEIVARFEIPKSYIDGGASRDSVIAARLEKSNNIYAKYNGSAGSSVPSQSCNSFNATTVDINAPDTTNIPCDPASVDKGDVSAYRDGKLSKIKICSYKGITVNSQVSTNFVNMMKAADSAGIPLSGGGFRSLEGQIAIYTSWCKTDGVTPTPGPYPKASYSDYNKCPGGAPPGYSNHEMGFAIDFNCSGVLIPRYYDQASSNSCFNWLVANANKYGFYEFAKGAKRNTSYYEAWHWSVDGT